MSPAGVVEMRQETVKMFYHGFDNYMKVAFPEDEVGGSWNFTLFSFFSLECLLTE